MLCLALSLCALPACSIGPPADEELAQLVTAGRHEVRDENGTLSGPGYEILLAEAGRARFVLLGESHGNRETPQLARALLADLRPAGYAAYAIETGPCSTEWFVGRAREDGRAAIATLTDEYPASIAFLSWREEAEALVAALEQGYAVWGIDQEFVASGRLLTAQLVELAPDAAARELAARWHGRAEDGFYAFVGSGDDSRGFMRVVTDADLDELDAAFAQGPAQAKAILAALRSSAAIYRHYHAGRYFENNRDRIRLMKRTLVERLDAADHPKTLIKLGSAHAGRGYSPFDQLDVGNLAAELGFAAGSDSFHVFVFGRRSIASDGSANDFAASTAYLRPFYDQLADAPRLFDLRGLRAWASARRESAPELHALIFRFDALLLFPALHAAEELVALPD